MAGIAQSSPIDSGETRWNAADEEIDVLEVDAPFGVRDQRDRQLVHPRISRESPARQLGQLPVVAAGQALAHLADVLLHDMEVVEQPFARGADVEITVGRGREACVGVVENPAGAVEPGEQGGVAPAAGATHEPLSGRDGAGAVAEVFGAQQLAADRTGKQLLAGVTWTLKEPAEYSTWGC